jgi:hypothetical protein
MRLERLFEGLGDSLFAGFRFGCQAPDFTDGFSHRRQHPPGFRRHFLEVRAFLGDCLALLFHLISESARLLINLRGLSVCFSAEINARLERRKRFSS